MRQDTGKVAEPTNADMPTAYRDPGPILTTNSTTITLSAPQAGARDPEYDWQPPLKDEPRAKRGRQCGECGMKFEYGKNYGYHCGSYQCPMGYGW